MAHVVIERTLTVAVGLLLAGPPLMVGAIGLGLPAGLAWLLPVGVAGAALLSGRVPPLPLAAARAHPLAALLWTAALAVAVTFSIRTSLYAHYPEAPRFSVAPGDRFREEHLCLTAYAEAARFLSLSGTNVYNRELYRPGTVPRRIGPFTVDYYHYPPPFLLLPSAVRLVAPDLFDFRRVWFALQTTTMMALWLAIAWWIGGTTGRRFALAGVVLFALPVTWASLQVGNIQTSVVAVALFGAMAVASGRVASGAGLLAAATLAKIFPGLLLAHVVFWGRPRFVPWAVAWGIGIVMLTVTAFGVEIFGEFAFGELPRMLSGESFPQTELPWAAPVNQSIYGFTVKLRQLGLGPLDQAAGKAITRILVLTLGVAVLAIGWRVVRPVRIESSEQRFALAVIVFGNVNLGSLIGPFVGGAYGAVYTMWLAVLVGVSAARAPIRLATLAAGVVLFLTTASVASPRVSVVPTTTTMLLAVAGGVALYAINIAAVWIGSRRLASSHSDRNATPA